MRISIVKRIFKSAFILIWIFIGTGLFLSYRAPSYLGDVYSSRSTSHIDIISVWPSDVNYDLIANNLDLLSLGIALGAMDPIRPGASLFWVALSEHETGIYFISIKTRKGNIVRKIFIRKMPDGGLSFLP